jgi:hypothetical protein
MDEKGLTFLWHRFKPNQIPSGQDETGWQEGFSFEKPCLKWPVALWFV